MSKTSEIWEFLESDELYPFFDWNQFDCKATFILEIPIEKYKTTEITGQYGTMNYIAIKACEMIEKPKTGKLTYYMLRISSVRLRKVLKEASDNASEFPVLCHISRTGTGYDTNYQIGFKKAPIAILSEIHGNKTEKMVEAQINKMNGLIDRKTAILMLLRESNITIED